jgi:hypothetical protein
MHLDNNKASIWLTVKANIRGLPKCTQLHGANVVAKASGAEAKACDMLARDKQQSLEQWRHSIVLYGTRNLYGNR